MLLRKDCGMAQAMEPWVRPRASPSGIDGEQNGALTYFTLSTLSFGGPAGVVGIATAYGLDGPGIESRWGGARFSAPVQTGPEAHPASYNMGIGSFPGVSCCRGVTLTPSPPSSVEVKNRVELYLYSP